MTELQEAIDMMERLVVKVDNRVFEGKRCPMCRARGTHESDCIIHEIYDWLALNSDSDLTVGSNVITRSGELGKIVHIATNPDHPYKNEPYLVEVISEDDVLGWQSWLGYSSLYDLKKIKDL